MAYVQTLWSYLKANFLVGSSKSNLTILQAAGLKSKRGVPQGYIIGLLLSNVFINDTFHFLNMALFITTRMTTPFLLVLRILMN